MRVISKETLVQLAANFNYDPIPEEVVDLWVKLYGVEIKIDTKEEE